MKYPDINEAEFWKLQILRQHLEDDPEYFDHPDCPYSETVKEFFLKQDQESASGEVSLSSLEQETITLFRELKEFGDMLNVEDVAERMSYYRTRTSLLDKILTIQKGFADVKAVHEFQNRVLSVVEEVLTPDQRTAVMERLKNG